MAIKNRSTRFGYSDGPSDWIRTSGRAGVPPVLPAAADCTRLRRQEAAGSAGAEKKRKPVLLTEYGLGTAGGIRTRDLLIRSQTLYPTELQPHVLQTAFIYYHHLFQNASPFFEKTKKIFGGGPARRATETEERAARCARGGGARFAMGRARKMGRNYR